jgi:sporulation protein YlmC with PRC-barrel domain
MATETTARAAVLRSREFLGRDVMDAGGTKVGTIKDLLLDRRSGTIRFLDVNLGLFKKQVIVPIDRVDWGEEAFVLRGFTREQLERLPPYDADRPLTGGMLDELVWAYPTFYGEEEARPASSVAGEPQIMPMSEAKDFRVRGDEPDLRGWNVFGADGERVGKVADLLVDPAAMKVAYLDVDLHEDLYNLKDDRHVVVPAAAVDLRERGQDVWVRDLSATDIARLPAYHGGVVDPVVMGRVADAFQGRGRRETGDGRVVEGERYGGEPREGEDRRV